MQRRRLRSRPWDRSTSNPPATMFLITDPSMPQTALAVKANNPPSPPASSLPSSRGSHGCGSPRAKTASRYFFAKIGHFDEVCAKNSDGTETCIDGDQLKSLLGATAAGTKQMKMEPDRRAAHAIQPARCRAPQPLPHPSRCPKPPALQRREMMPERQAACPHRGTRTPR